MSPDGSSNKIRLLFADDEPNIRLTLPPILEMNGFQVTVASTVAEALTAIHSKTFDVLLSDLNISHPADGFTVVGAMRSVQPQCVTLILTGYPAFETALQAIRSRVDDYLTKPADIHYLLRTLREKLQEPRPAPALIPRRLVSVFHENIDSIVEYTLEGMKDTPELAEFPLTDAERISDLRPMLHAMVRALESAPAHDRRDLLRPASEHGRNRRNQGYTAPMIVEDTRCIHNAIGKTVEENLLGIDISELFPDWNLVHALLQGQLKASITAFLEIPGEPFAMKTAKTA